MPAMVVFTGAWACCVRNVYSRNGRFCRMPSVSVTAGSSGGGPDGSSVPLVNGTGAGTSGLYPDKLAVSGSNQNFRRTSPSVMTSTPHASWSAIASSAARSCVATSSSSSISWRSKRSNASFRYSGRSRLPTTSAR